MAPELPSFDLVVASVDRADPLGAFLDSLERQAPARFRVLLVDQNEDDRLDPVVAAHPRLEILRLRSARGLSRARNAGLEQVGADLVGFPDDDCVYPDGLLLRVAERFAADPALGGLSGRAIDRGGRSAASWKSDPVALTRDNLWNRAISFAIFLRRDVVTGVEGFDERLGLGSGEPWSSGEEIDYLIRALDAGARVEYDPSLLVEHDVRENDVPIGLRDGASVGYLLRKHRYPPRMLGRMLVRPVGGVLVSLARRDRAQARFRAATLRGRIRGYLGASSSKSSR